jgi:hypothetical protein
MTDDKLVREFLEKIIELFGPPTEPILLHVRTTSEPAQPGDEAATATETATLMRLIMKAKDLYPSKYACAADLDGPRVETIEKVTHEEFKQDGMSVKKAVIHFCKNGDGGPAFKPVVLNKTNWKFLVAITGEDDDDNWGGHQIELRSEMVNAPGGKIVDSIRVHKAPGAAKPAKAKAKDVPFNDSVDF